MQATFATDEAFHDGIFFAVQHGLNFDADHETLTITYSGGY